jgi:hypothetical protein
VHWQLIPPLLEPLLLPLPPPLLLLDPLPPLVDPLPPPLVAPLVLPPLVDPPALLPVLPPLLAPLPLPAVLPLLALPPVPLPLLVPAPLELLPSWLPLPPLLPLVPLLSAVPLLALPLPLRLAPDELPSAMLASMPSGASPSMRGACPASPAPPPVPDEELPAALPPLLLCTDGSPTRASLELPMLTSGKPHPATVVHAASTAHDATAQWRNRPSRHASPMAQ